MNLKSITFVFENCDFLTVDGKYIGDFIVDEIGTSIHRVAGNSIGRFDICNNFFIEISKNANKRHSPFGLKNKDLETTVFKELNKNDITKVELELEQSDADGLTAKKVYFDYVIKWDENNDNVNLYSHTMVSDCGNLYIFIKKDGFWKDYVDMKEINDEERMKEKFNLYGVEYD